MSSGTENSLVALVKNACNGDNTAREEIIRRFHDQIYRLVLFRVKNRADAEDITQEVFIKVLKNIRKLKNPEHLKPWIYAIAVNQVKDFFKKKRLLLFLGISADLEQLPAPVPETASNRSVEKNNFHRLLNRFLETLPQSERETFLLKYIDGLTIAEVARVLGKNENTIKTHLYRSVNKLKNRPSLEKQLFAEVYDAN